MQVNCNTIIDGNCVVTKDKDTTMIINGSAIAFGNDNAFTITTWSTLPPTNDDFIACGASIVHYERKNTSNEPNVYVHDVLHTLVPSYSENTTVKQTVKPNAKKLVGASWAIRLYPIRYRMCGEWYRIGTIAENKTDGKLFLFDEYGIPIKPLPKRKHITPKYIAKFVVNDKPYNIDVNCIQCDAIAKAKKERRTKDHRRVPNTPKMVRSANINNGNKSQRSYDAPMDLLPLDNERYSKSNIRTNPSDDVPMGLDAIRMYLESHMEYDSSFASYDEQIEFMLDSILKKDKRIGELKTRTTIEYRITKDGKRKPMVVA